MVARLKLKGIDGRAPPGVDEIQMYKDEETLFLNPSISILPCSELKEKS